MLSAALILMESPAYAGFLVAANLSGDQERPNPISTTATGFGSIFVNDTAMTLTVNLSTQGLAGNITDLDIHVVPAGLDPVNNNGDVRYALADLANLNPPIPNSASSFTLSNFVITGITAQDIADLRDGRAYFNVHDTIYSDPVGEIRGNLRVVPEPSSLVLQGIGILGALGYSRRWGFAASEKEGASRTPPG